MVFTETLDAGALTVQTQITKSAVLAGVTLDLLEADWTRTHSCPVLGALVLVGDGLGLGFVVLVGDGLGLALCEPLFDGDGLGELPDGDGELDPDALGLAEPLDEGLALLEAGLALLSDFFDEGVALAECVSALLAVVSSAAPIVLPAAVVVAFEADVLLAE